MYCGRIKTALALKGVQDELAPLGLGLFSFMMHTVHKEQSMNFVLWAKDFKRKFLKKKNFYPRVS